MVKRARAGVADVAGVAEAIERGEIPPVWVWGGPETYRKEELFARLAEGVVDPATASLNVLRFLGESDPIEQVLLACQTIPMFGGRRAVLLKNVEKLDRGEREALAAYVEHPAAETSLVLTGRENPGKDAWLGRLIEAGGEGAAFWIPSPAEATTWIQDRFSLSGKRCPPDVARDLLAACTPVDGERVPLADIAPEIDKILSTVGDRPAIASEDIAGTARKAHDDLLYAVARAVMLRDASTALTALDGALLFRDVNEVRVVATLTFRLLHLLKARDLQDSGTSDRDPLANRFRWSVWGGTSWAEIERAARSWSGSALRRGLALLAEADLLLKSSSRDPRLVLESTVINLCGLK